MHNVITSERADHRFTESLLNAMSDFPRDAIHKLEEASAPHKYERGKAIIKEGQLSGGIFLLLAGAVQPWMSVPSWTSKKRDDLPAIFAPAVLEQYHACSDSLPR